MKKSTDTIIRIFFIIAIFGAIGHYYYQKFKHPIAPVIKSPMIQIPSENLSIPQKDNNSVQIHKAETSVNPTEVEKKPLPAQKKVEKQSKTFKVTISNIPVKSSLVKDTLSFLNTLSTEIKTSKTEKQGIVLFKRVLIGPYYKKTDMIKESGKIDSMKIDSLRLKIKKNYYIHVGSFSNKNKLNEFVKYLRKHGINNIVFMDVKVPKKTIEIRANNIDNASLTKLKDFLTKNGLTYKITE
jgi:cell division protein FtsN